jgi:thiosulfate/3-mercaptopyruvate sulfurtransferase
MTTDIPHMMPNKEKFESTCEELDINKTDYIICYDIIGNFSSPRVWFNLKIYGFTNVYVLDGGLNKWIKESRNVEIGEELKFKVTINIIFYFIAKR